jgi:hypothetical protein
LDLKTGALKDQDVPSFPAKADQYHNTIKYIIRDKSHSKSPVHSIVAEIANAMTNPGHSGRRRGASPATGPVSSAWLRLRTVMSMAISCHRSNEISDRLERGTPIQSGKLFGSESLSLLSHKICQNEIVI